MLFIQCITCIIHKGLYISIVVLSKSLYHQSKHYAQRSSKKDCESTEVTLFLRGGRFVFRTLPLSVSWPESHPTDEIRQRWVDSDCNRDNEYKPSPRCSLSQTGPNGPGSWAGPGTGTGSAREERECLLENEYEKYTNIHARYIHKYTVLIKSIHHLWMFSNFVTLNQSSFNVPFLTLFNKKYPLMSNRKCHKKVIEVFLYPSPDLSFSKWLNNPWSTAESLIKKCMSMAQL